MAYPASVHNINEYDAEGKLIELPIYTEMRPFWDFISPIRIMRMIRNKMHKFNKPKGENVERVKSLEMEARKNDNRHITLKSFFVKSPLKMDFNQVSARGLRRMMKNIMRRVNSEELRVNSVDVVLIGHSKTFVPYNEKTLEPFLKWLKKHNI